MRISRGQPTNLNRLLLFIWFATLLGFAAPGWCLAGEHPIYGPQDFEMERGRWIPITIPFSAPVPTNAHRFELLNGGQSGQFSLLTGALIKVNGNTIIVPSDFTHDDNVITRTVPLNASNQFYLDLRGGIGGGATVVIYGQDNDLPDLMFTAPADGGGGDNTKPTFTLQYSDLLSGVDLTSFALTVDGQSVTDQTQIGPTSASYTPTTDLPRRQIQAVAAISDRAGNRRVAILTFSVNSGHPFLAIADCFPTSGAAPLTVRFKGRGVFPGGTITEYRWDLNGDGFFEKVDQIPRDHILTYTTKGTYNVKLELRNNFGDVATATCPIVVGGTPPVVTADVNPSNGPVGFRANFTVTASDADGTIALYQWDFDGNGTYDHQSTTSGNVSHVYPFIGQFTAKCRVTDNDGISTIARTTTTVIRALDPGSPSIVATATPAEGSSPLTVSLSGSALSAPSAIRKWEWDFEGDGTFDYSSTTSPTISHVYTRGGILSAVLRATDGNGRKASDNVAVTVNVTASLSIPDDTFDASHGETATISTNISAGVNARVEMRAPDGTPVRTVFEGFHPAGSQANVWDGRDDAGNYLPQGAYYAVLLYDFSGVERSVDLTSSTGGIQYSPSRSTARNFAPFQGDLLPITFTISPTNGPTEVSVFVGLFFDGSQFLSLLDRVPFGVGQHTVYWDGLTPDGSVASPPPGEQFLIGITGVTLAENAIFLQSAPVISSLVVSPNLFDPSSVNSLSPNGSVATATFSLDRPANARLTIVSLQTGITLRTINATALPAGDGHVIIWDGKTDDGTYVDRGNYRLALVATDSSQSSSLTRYALMRVYY